MAKWVEYFIAQRTSQRATSSDEAGEKHPPEGAMMARVATLAVALSVAIMILSLAVIFGFQSEVHSRLTSLSGDIIVASSRGVSSVASYPINRSERLRSMAREAAAEFGVELRRMNPYATRGVILRTAEGIEGVLLKGIDAESPTEMFERGLIEGEIPSFGEERYSRNAIISNELASVMALSVGDRLELLATLESGELRRDLYRVGAIYSGVGGESERLMVITDLRNVQRLNGWSESEVSGYEISLSKRESEVEVAIAERINREILYSDDAAMAQTAAYATRELYPSLFDWLAALDMNGAVVISIMVVVAIFNIVTALLILILERVQMIGVLKAIGMNNKSLRSLFLLRALKITLWGLAWGNGVGIAIALIQRHFDVIKLDEAGYLLSSVPIQLDVEWIALLNVGVVVVIVATVTLPTRIVGSIEPHKAIRFQ